MMSRSQVLDTRSHGYILPFKQAVIATERALRRKWGNGTEIPLLSHALSDHDGTRWHISDIAGNPIAVVNSTGKALLADELIEDE